MTTQKRVPRRGGMARNFIHLGLGQATTTVMTIVISYTLARVLTTSEFGLLFLLTSTATFAFVVVDWGHGTVVVREASRHPEKAGELFGSTLAMRTIGAAIAGPMVIAIMWLLGYETLTCLLAGVAVVVALPQYLGLSFGWVFRAYERMDREALINVVFKFANFLCAVVCVLLGGRVLGLILACSVAGWITLFLAISWYRKLQLPTITAHKATSRQLLREGAPIFAMSLAVAVEPVFNANILYKLSSPEAAAWYGAAWTIAGSLVAPATVLATAMYPRLSPAADDPVEFKRIMSVSFRPLFVVAMLGATGTYLFADVPVKLVFGFPKFMQAAETLRAFAPLLLLMYVNLFLSTAVLALGKASWLAISKIGAVALVLGLSFVLVPYCEQRFGNGGLGVMYAMLVGEFLMAAVSWVLVRQAIDGRMVGEILRCVVASAATLLLFELLPEFTPFIGIPLCVLVFGAVSWVVGAIRRSDVDMLLASLRKPKPAASAA